MTTVSARAVAAAAALEPLGLHLIVGRDEFIITATPDSADGTAVRCPAISQVEDYIAARVQPPQPVTRCPAGPQVGGIVHYVSHGSPVRPDGTQAYKSMCRAAVVTEVYDTGPAPDGAPYTGLCVLNPTGQFFTQGVRYDGGTFTGPAREASPGEPLPQVTCGDLTFEGGTWHWGGDR